MTFRIVRPAVLDPGMARAFDSIEDMLRRIVGVEQAGTTLVAASGASVTATGLIPDGAVVIGVTTRVREALGTTNGTTGYTVGDGSDVDRWGAITGTAVGTSSDNSDATATGVDLFTSATSVVLTATGGNFDGDGAIDVTAHYLKV